MCTEPINAVEAQKVLHVGGQPPVPLKESCRAFRMLIPFFREVFSRITGIGDPETYPWNMLDKCRHRPHGRHHEIEFVFNETRHCNAFVRARSKRGNDY